MKKVFLFFNLLVLISAFAQEEQEKDTVNKLDEVLLFATRAKEKSPFAHSTINKEALEDINMGQDLPMLIDQMPSVVTTSDAGAGVGYTGIRVRGSDATRVNVTLNGIPYNDSESQGTYWVDLPDFVSSVEDIQLQRGVGTSTNGSAAFGASLSLKTLEASKKGYAKTSQAIGSFNTRKHNLSIGSGIHKGFYAEGRMSKINSDGFVDRAYSDLFSFYTETGFKNKKTSIKAIVFGGKEKTYQSWYGTPEAVINGDLEGIEDFINRNYSSDLEADNLRNAGRTYNHYLYDNQIDNYGQNHYQLHFTQKFNSDLSANLSFNYTKGKGYYEQYKDAEKVKEYFPNHEDGSERGDVVRRRWLDNDFYALVYSFNYKKEKIEASLGGGYNTYFGDHFGKIIWDSFPVDIPVRSEYYNNTGQKNDFNVYTKMTYTINTKFTAFADAQVRKVLYKATGLSSDLLNIDVATDYLFFNPKLGLNYKLNNFNSLYASFAVANREPNRDDLVKNPILPNHEQLFDWEVGYRLKKQKYYTTANLYYMNYKDQLVLTGAVDDVGDPIRQNVDQSYRAGLELQTGIKLADNLRIDANATFSQNIIKSYEHIVYDTQYDPNTWDIVSYEALNTTYTDTNISFSPTIIAGGTLSYSPIKNLNVSIISKYVGKQYLDNTSDESKIIKSYAFNNLSLSYKIQPSWIKEISLNLLINNLFDEKYESNGYTYSYYWRSEGSNDAAITEKFYYPQAGTNFLMGVNLTL
jgi:iron complex outermembrane receptor protein